jgi:putative aldouronate transport system substrate-binding protein
VAELYAMAKAFRQKDPGGAGERLVPFAIQGSPTQSFGIWESVVLPGFVKDRPTAEKLLVPPPLWPETRDALRFLNRLYNEKLMGDFILDKDGTLFKQRLARGDIGAFVGFGHFPFSAAYGNLYEKLQQSQPQATLRAAFPWRDPDSPEAFINLFRGTPYLYQFFSPATAAHPDKVMAYLDWMASEEGYRAANLGIQGTDYRLTDGVPIPLDDAAYALRVAWVEPQYMAFTKPFASKGEERLYLENAARSFPAPLREQFVKETITLAALHYATPRITLPTPFSDRLRATIDKRWEAAMAAIVTADTVSFQRLFDDAVRAYRRDGGEEIVKELTAAYAQQQRH